MTTTKIILVSILVGTEQNVTGNSRLPVRIIMWYLLGGENECKPHQCKAIICPLKVAKMQCSSSFYRGVPPKVLVARGTIAFVKVIESQIEWVCFKFKLSQKRKQFLMSDIQRE